ncbi:hypothetical protein HAX54_015016 [Datura stramonium]|uniref:Hydroxymethylglutaryl-coenzyme A synthase C-terminal domain-containing protein n=1 Tax=Datura stramonium TaxID=4076 RepID=A0ABS8RZS3_DATST|nr:hypothetical protein [Datura stramonium]
MLVQKSFGRLLYNDFLRNASSIDESARQILVPFESLTGDESYQSRDLDEASQQAAKPFYDEKVELNTLIPNKLATWATIPSCAAFASLLHNKHDTLAGQRVIMFSYGVGSTATTATKSTERLQKRYENACNLLPPGAYYHIVDSEYRRAYDKKVFPD